MVHLAGSHNVIADAISRNLMQVFFSHVPKSLTPVPESIWEVLVTQQPDWLSTIWQKSLTNSLSIVWHQAHERLTHPHKQIPDFLFPHGTCTCPSITAMVNSLCRQSHSEHFPFLNANLHISHQAPPHFLWCQRSS